MDATTSLIDRLVHTSRLSRPRLALVLGVLLALLLLLAAWVEGRLQAGVSHEVWALGLAGAVIVYVLLIFPVSQRYWQRSVEVLRPLAAQPGVVEGAFAISRRGEWVAVAVGAAFGVWITLSLHLVERWLVVYALVTNVAMFGLTALSVHDGIVRSRGLTRIVRAGVRLDLFDRARLVPLARWGQSISLTFVGGICVSLFFQSFKSLNTVQSLVIYSVLLAVALGLFFSSMWSIHVALAAAQQRELAMVRAHWQQARGSTPPEMAALPVADALPLYAPLVVLGHYERMVLEASTWPFDPKIVRQLAASIAAPVLIYSVKIAAGLSSLP